jgi:hypothetical protein
MAADLNGRGSVVDIERCVDSAALTTLSWRTVAWISETR